MDDYLKVFHKRKNLKNFGFPVQDFSLFGTPPRSRPFLILDIRFVERIFKINNELNNGIMQSFFDPRGVSLSRFDCNFFPKIADFS